MYRIGYVTVKVHKALQCFVGVFPATLRANESRSDARRAGRGARGTCRAGRVRAHDGRASRGPRQPRSAGAGGERFGRREHLRQPDPVRPERGLQPLPARRGRRPGAAREPRRRPRRSSPRSTRCIRRTPRTSVDVGPPRRACSKAPRGRDTSGEWRRSSRCSSTWSSPTAAYFGQKDGQQSVVIRRITRDLGLPVEIVICPTVREDGRPRPVLAQPLPDSRRTRPGAGAPPRASRRRRTHLRRRDRSADRLRAADGSRAHHCAARAGPDYVSIADADTLEELDTVDRPALASLAVRFPSARLIDCLPLDPQGRRSARRPEPTSLTSLTRRPGRRLARRASRSASPAPRSASRTLSMSRCSLTSRRVSSIFSRSAGWVLTSRSCTFGRRLVRVRARRGTRTVAPALIASRSRGRGV